MDDIYYKVAHRSQKEMNSFATRYDDFDTVLIPEIFHNSLGFRVNTWRQSESWGSSHVVYFVRVEEQDEELVLRANLGISSPEIVMQVEKLVTGLVDEIDIPTNKVVFVDVSREKYPFDFQIQEKLAGNDLEDHFKGTKKDYDKMSYDLGVYIARYSDLEFPMFGLFDEEAALEGKLKGTKRSFYDYLITKLEDDLRYLVEFKEISPKVADQVIDVFEQRKRLIDVEKGSLVHHDLADHNIFFKGNEITGIFDWEACVVGDPVLDLASCPTWKTHYPREKILLDGFRSVKKLPENHSEKADLYRLRTILWKTVFCQRINILTPERRARLGLALMPFKIGL
ncbi:MAG: aminoglycoside phosphotransferase family protein [Candidatus Dojkabacteria bacterium]|jgi:aminoglycoside phosphotransferase (APT) family kinase protein|nr:aminoglycoside phosphotransferase family protein [Candidatus Dojkabacteria bacterium]